jgi:hypothetical protein
MKKRTGLCATVLGLSLPLLACSSDPLPTAPAGAAGSPGVTAGSGPTAGGGTGTAGGTAPVAAGSSAAGGGAPAGEPNVTTCVGAATGATLYADAAAWLLPAGSKTCAFSSCHDAKAHKASLILEGTDTTMDLKTLLVDKPSCEVPTLSLIASGGGDAALAKSWLWQKLTAPADPSGNVTAKPEWGTATSCGQMGGFGVRMPMGQVDLSPTAKLDAVRSWICGGATGP